MALRITLIHATALSIKPVEEVFAATWPEVELVNLLEDSLSRDRAKTQGLTESMMERFEVLGDYAVKIGSDAILFTCSAFAGAIENVQRRLTIPVLKPNEAMVEAALEQGTKIGIVATFAPTIESMTAEVQEMAAARGVALDLHIRHAAGAMEALAAGDANTHDQRILSAAADLKDVDVIILAQFSMARAATKLRPQTNIPVLTSPDAAVAKLQRLLADA